MTFDTKFEMELRRVAHERLSALIQSLINRQAVTTFQDYHFLAGQIEALRIVLPELCEEANDAINGEKTGD